MIGMLWSKKPVPSSGCGTVRQVDNKDLYPELLMIHGHCSDRTQRDRPCSVALSNPVPRDLPCSAQSLCQAGPAP